MDGGFTVSRILAVDPGEARLGLALSDPTRTVARPLEVLAHRSREGDAQAIVAIAEREGATTIVVGIAYDDRQELGPQARRGMRLAEALRQAGAPDVKTWDESGSTQAALATGEDDRQADARAAAFILQGFLDALQET